MVAAKRSPRSPHQRLQSDTRLDVLSLMAGSSKRQGSTSPKDSLSPCDEHFQQDNNVEDHNGESISTPPDQIPVDGQLHKRQAQTPRKPFPIRTSSLQQKHLPDTPSHASASPQTTRMCEPRSRSRLTRSRCPPALYIDTVYGLTTQTPHDLRRIISRTAPCEAKTQTVDYDSQPSPQPRYRRRIAINPPPVPPKSLARQSSIPSKMGNQHSHHAAGADTAAEDGDGQSLRSVIRSPKGKNLKLPRRSSMGNVFKRLDSKSPLPQDFSATVIEVPRAATAPNLDGMGEDDDEEFDDDEKDRGRARHAHHHSAPSPTIPVHPASPATMTEESAGRPLSTSDTITDHDRTQYDDEDTEALRVSALSPSLPTPSPLPEDSPHKYGLKDRMDTPEAPPSPPDINVIKARRRSSGLEIFNEAKSLQSASSFLNGLSTARRRAESRAGATSRSNLHSSRNLTDLSNTTYSTTATTRSTSYLFTNGPTSTNASSTHLGNRSHPTLSYLHPSNADADHLDLLPPPSPDLLSRNMGHSTKSSGFAYARPLAVTQLKCFRNHNRLLLSRNKHAPVECAVCHRDDEQDHWSCSWCAIRMCGGCRRDFGKRGGKALRERVRGAEMGGNSSEGFELADEEEMFGRRSRRASSGFGGRMSGMGLR